MRFFTSDTHFGHANIIAHCKRPFKDVEEMDEEMIRRWNAIVGPNDAVFHMGDFTYHNATKTKEIVSRLNGTIVLVEGNHDKKPCRFFGAVLKSGTVTFAGDIGDVQMSHYPYIGTDYDDYGRDFSRLQLDDKGDWLLHGHVHCLWKRKNRMINVGVDQWAFAPVSEQELVDFILGEGL